MPFVKAESSIVNAWCLCKCNIHIQAKMDFSICDIMVSSPKTSHALLYVLIVRDNEKCNRIVLELWYVFVCNACVRYAGIMKA